MESNADPKTWGPHVWATMHAFALFVDQSHNAERLVAFRDFLKNLTALLPCATCRHDYGAYIAKHELPEIGKAFEWTVGLHNYVNGKIGKAAWTVSDAKAQWTSSSCTYACNGSETQSLVVKRPLSPNLVSNSIAILCLTILVAIGVWYSMKPSSAGAAQALHRGLPSAEHGLGRPKPISRLVNQQQGSSVPSAAASVAGLLSSAAGAGPSSLANGSLQGHSV
jgi:hypothetical protein